MPSASQVEVPGVNKQTVEFVKSDPPVAFVARAGSVSPVWPSKIELNGKELPAISAMVSGAATATGGSVTVGVIVELITRSNESVT